MSNSYNKSEANALLSVLSRHLSHLLFLEILSMGAYESINTSESLQIKIKGDFGYRKLGGDCVKSRIKMLNNTKKSFHITTNNF